MPRKKNRRRERRHVLDVKLSSNQVRRRRAQLGLSALFAIIFLSVTIYGLWRGGWWAVQRFVYHNDQLQIREFDVRTDGVINIERLKEWSGVRLGDNLFAVDLNAIQRHLEMQGMIRKAILERVLPGTLRLQVFEREPLALVRLHFSNGKKGIVAREYGVDEAGRVIPLDPSVVRPETVQSWARLPRLTGLDDQGVIPGKNLTNELAHAALDFVTAFNNSAMKRLLQLATIDLSGQDVLQLQTSQGNRVDVLDHDFPRQLARWEAIHRYCASSRVSYAWVDLSPTNNIPLRTAPLAIADASASNH